jgi:plasmid maintenance system antidote protein VapI
MAKRKAQLDPIVEVASLLKKLTILRLHELGVSQGAIAQKLKVDIHSVNDFLKGTKRQNDKKK